MGLDALCPLCARLVEVMLLRVECGGGVATQAQAVAFLPELQSVRFMAIHAGDTALVHPALEKRSPGIVLLALLSVGVVVRLRKQRQTVRHFERSADLPSFGNRGAAGVTSG